jgi:L-asparaginase II
MNHSRLVEIWRGPTIESVHNGSIAVMSPGGELVASMGDPAVLTYMRSSAKPLQALPLVETGATEAFNFKPAELAICCASHAGTDQHIETVRKLQAKIGISEDDLQCGIHLPYDQQAQRQLIRENLRPRPLGNNCSGKHTGMLALSKHLSQPLEDYLELDHPVQVAILEAVKQMTGVEPVIGIDGCSAPNFAVPLQAAAWAYARLMDPSGLPEARANACRQIVDAMRTHPLMVSGPGRFDTRLMEVTGGRILAKGGADGFQAMGIPAGGSDRPHALGIAIKIADGDFGKRALGPVSVAVLASLGAINLEERRALADFDEGTSQNLRDLDVGKIRVCFDLLQGV